MLSAFRKNQGDGRPDFERLHGNGHQEWPTFVRVVIHQPFERIADRAHRSQNGDAFGQRGISDRQPNLRLREQFLTQTRLQDLASKGRGRSAAIASQAFAGGCGPILFAALGAGD